MSGNTSNCSTARSVTLSHLATPSPPLAELLARPDSKGVLGTLGILNVFVCARQRKSFDWFRSGRLVGELSDQAQASRGASRDRLRLPGASGEAR